MLDKCPICGEPRLRFSCGVNHFSCGTIGPYIKDGEEEYETGHTCDIHTYSRLFTQMEKERDELQQRLAAAEARVSQLERERDEWKAACQTRFKVNVDTPLFSGLAGGSFAPGVLLASLHAVTAERNEARDAARWLFATTNNYRQFDAEERWPWLIKGDLR